MSEELSSSFFSLTGKTGRLAYFFQNSVVMLFGFQYIYGPYLAEAILKMQHSPLFENSFALVKSLPGYSEMMNDIAHSAKPDSSQLMIKLAFIIVLRVIDLKRVRDIVNRKLSAIETTLIAVFFSLPFVDFFSTIMLVTLPPKKKSSENTFLKEAHATDLKIAQQERLLKQNKDMFEAGKISRADFEKNRAKYSDPTKK